MMRATFATFALLASTPALASHYVAQPAAKPAQAKIVVRDLIWSCGDTGCSAAKNGSRPAIVCASLAKEVGKLESFSVAGAALGPAELEKCNARAD